MTGVFLAEGSSDFRLVDRKVLVVLLSFKDTDIFFRGAVQWVGFRRTTVPFAVEARFSGTTKYSLRKMLKFASGAIGSFSVIPLKFSVYVGLATTMLSIVEILYVVVMYMRGATVPGWASVIGITSLLFGVLFVNLGVIGIYLARLHVAAQGRPRFVVAEVIGKTASQ
jgi:dolichol-phosphate mannosyltransferase